MGGVQKVNAIQFQKLKSIVVDNGNADVCNCPVWPKFDAKVMQIEDGSEVRLRYWSPRAGGFYIFHPFTVDAIRYDEARKLMSSWVWARNAAFDLLGDNDEGEVPELTKDLIKEICQLPALTIEQRIDRALQVIGRPPKFIVSKALDGPASSSSVQYQWQFQAAAECTGKNEMLWLLGEMETAGLVCKVGSPPATPEYMLTLKGLNRLDTGGEPLISNTAFVAMWFNSKTETAYVSGIEAAIKDAGFLPVRIDRKEHSRKIDDEIIAEIRRCRFMVCGLTSGLISDPDSDTGHTPVARGSVYHEAGFSHGLGKDVIWTCRKDLIDHIHFDLHQYSCVPWETGKEEDLREALVSRIRAVIV